LEEAERKVELLLRERGEVKAIPFEAAKLDPASENDRSASISSPHRDDEQDEKLNDSIPF
jgi:hypothetical protein